MNCNEMSKDIQKKVRIWDADAAEKLERIQALPQYKSFNKVINDVVDRGLPILYKELFGGDETEEEENWEPPAFPEEPRVEPPDEEFYTTLIALLKEFNVNVLLNKQMLSGIFRFLVLISDGTLYEESARLLEKGRLNLTPDCLMRQEAEGLKEVTRLQGGRRNDQ